MELFRKLRRSLEWVTLPDEDAPTSRTISVLKQVAGYVRVLWGGLYKAMLWVYNESLPVLWFIPEALANADNEYKWVYSAQETLIR